MKQDPNQLLNQTLGRALLVLDAFSSEQPEYGVRSLSRKVGLNVATVYRIVSTLQAAGYLVQEPETQRYALGPKVTKLASLYRQHNPIVSIANRIFASYIDRFPFNFYLGQLCIFEVVYLTFLDGPGPIKISIEPPSSIELHTTALGKVLLAYQTPDYIKEFLSTLELKTFTSRTITDPAVLFQQIQETKIQGYAINDGERYDDIGAVAVPVYDNLGRVMVAVSLAYPRHHIREGRLDLKAVIQLAREIGHEITVRSGGVEQANPSRSGVFHVD